MNNRQGSSGQWRRLRPWLTVYVAAIVVVAVVAGFVWTVVVRLPSYTIDSTYRAVILESGLSQIGATDVYYTLVGLVAGLVIGVTAWVLFRRVGWPVTLLAVAGGALAGLITRGVGEFIGARDFEKRIAQAARGDSVVVDFTSHTWVPLAVWAGGAVLPVLVGSFVRRRGWIAHVPATTPGGAGEAPGEPVE
ncbi:MAG: hypothetical protein LBI33_00145 [Propionibacteriaceae bacterium]|jgi:hypothetical protein|nr:hypothetical protein [Propionibacteriaceae bacterium]